MKSLAVKNFLSVVSAEVPHSPESLFCSDVNSSKKGFVRLGLCDLGCGGEWCVANFVGGFSGVGEYVCYLGLGFYFTLLGT